jgi:rfaE bifunctional protein nucleotidyltransferase chain/domain
MSTTHRKICSLAQLLEFRRAAAANRQTVVHCHGCFDIVHPGHIQYLQFARSLGDALIVTVSADPQVNKGINRPLIPDDLRAGSLAALECVDRVYVNPHPTAVEVLDALKPDIYVKGREYEENQDPRFLAERDTVTRNGGRVIFSSGDVIYSSTALIRIQRRKGPPLPPAVRPQQREPLKLDHALPRYAHGRRRRLHPGPLPLLRRHGRCR